MARRKYNIILNGTTPVEEVEKIKKVRKKIAKSIEKDTEIVDGLSEEHSELTDYDEVFGEDVEDIIGDIGYPETGLPEIIRTLKSFVSISVQLQKTRMAAGGRLYSAVATAYGLDNTAKHKASKKPELKYDDEGNVIDVAAEKSKKEENSILKKLVEEFNIVNRQVLSDIYKSPIDEKEKGLDKKFKSLELSKSVLVKKTIHKLLAVPEDCANLKYLKTFPLYMLTKAYVDFLDMEKNHKDQLEYLLNQIPVYKHYLKHVRGVGPTMAAAIISKLDYTKDTFSKWIKYCGMDVVIDPETGKGVGRTNHKEHQILRDYERRDGTMDKKWSITYDPWIKSKLLGVLTTCISKDYFKIPEKNVDKKKASYYGIYLNYKHRILNDPARQEVKTVVRADGTTKEYKVYNEGRVHKMANRYMIKFLLLDLYINWRAMEGLTSREPYQDEKLSNDDGSKHVSRIRTIDYFDPKNPEFVEIPWSEHDNPRYLCSSKFDKSVLK